MAAKAFLVLTLQNIWIMPPKLELWTMSRFSSYQGIKTLLEDISNRDTSQKPEAFNIYGLQQPHFFYFALYCQRTDWRHGVKANLKTQGKDSP